MPLNENSPFLLTIDVEPDWGISGHDGILQTLPRFCGMLRRLRIPATFFVVAGLVDSCGEFLRRELADYEIGSHGLTHRALPGLTDDEVFRELSESRHKLEQCFGRPVTGFRAPYLKVPSQWFHLLGKAGYCYDSSMGAVTPSLQNRHPAYWQAVKREGILEIPVTSLCTGWIPFSLTYLRLLAPLGVRLVSAESAIMYLHLHELANPEMASLLPWRLRMVLRRNAGEPAWDILERVLAQFAGRAKTCGEFAAGFGREG